MTGESTPSRHELLSGRHTAPHKLLVMTDLLFWDMHVPLLGCGTECPTWGSAIAESGLDDRLRSI